MDSAIEFKSCELELKSEGDNDPGVLEGYCATWDGPDRAGETILKGAFAATIPEFIQSGFLAVEHDWRQDIGTIESCEEDERGLRIKARFFDTPDAQLVRRKLAAKAARNRKQAMSIGYRVQKDYRQKGVRYLTQLDLYECSIVAVGANPVAGVSAVKSISPTDDDYARAGRMRRLIIDQSLRRHAPKGCD